jgi:integrase
MIDNKPVLSDFVKTDSSVRVASVAPFAIEALRELERSQPIRSLDRSGLVFLSTTGTPLSPRNALRDFHIQCERSGLGTRHLHELRHAFACEMLRQGVPLEVVSRQLGHKSLNITSDLYGHIKPAEMPAMTAALERAFA